MDLIFPHHENEIAQSEAANGQEFSRYWMHGGFLEIDKEKMAKSLGNFVTIKDVLERNDAEAFRYFVLGTHYRGPLSFDVEKNGRRPRDVPRRSTRPSGAMDYLYSTRDALAPRQRATSRGGVERAPGPGEDRRRGDATRSSRRSIATSTRPVALSVLAELGKAANEIVMQFAEAEEGSGEARGRPEARGEGRARARRRACAPMGLMQADVRGRTGRAPRRDASRIRGLEAADDRREGRRRAREARKAKDFAHARRDPQAARRPGRRGLRRRRRQHVEDHTSDGARSGADGRRERRQPLEHEIDEGPHARREVTMARIHEVRRPPRPATILRAREPACSPRDRSRRGTTATRRRRDRRAPLDERARQRTPRIAREHRHGMRPASFSNDHVHLARAAPSRGNRGRRAPPGSREHRAPRRRRGSRRSSAPRSRACSPRAARPSRRARARRRRGPPR